MNSGRGRNEHGKGVPATFDLADVATRLDSLIRWGRVFDFDYDAGRVRVRYGREEEENMLETDWLPWVTLRASNNRTWQVPEMDEQCLVFSPSGNMAQAFVLFAMNYDEYPLPSNDPDYEVFTFYKPRRATDSGAEKADEFEKDELWARLEFNRNTGIRRWWLKQSGQYRWEVGEKEGKKTEDLPPTQARSCIVMDQYHIQLRVGDTQMVMDDKSIRLLINGRQSEITMTPDTIFSQVQDSARTEMLAGEITHSVDATKGRVKILRGLVELSVDEEGVLSVRSNVISAKLESMQVRVALLSTSIKMMVKRAWFRLTQSEWDVRTNGSSLTGDAEGVTMVSPKFAGIQGSALTGVYQGGSAADAYEAPAPINPPATVEPPEPTEGGAPYRPGDEEEKEEEAEEEVDDEN